MDGGVVRSVHHGSGVSDIECHIPSRSGAEFVPEICEAPLQPRIPHNSSDKGGRFLGCIRGHEAQALVIDTEKSAESVVPQRSILRCSGPFLRDIPFRPVVVLPALDNIQTAALEQNVLGRGSLARRASGRADSIVVAVGFFCDQIDDAGEGLRTVEDGARPLYHFDTFQNADGERLQDVAADPAFEDLAHGAAVNQDQDVPGVGAGLVAPDRDQTAVPQESAADVEAGHAFQYFKERSSPEPFQLILSHDRYDARRVGEFFGEFRRGRYLGVE